MDETANIKKAANDILRGSSFDNNILCTAEKEAFIINSVFNELRNEMIRLGAYELKQHEIDIVTKEVFVKNNQGETVVNRKYVGKNASEILSAIYFKLGDYKNAYYFKTIASDIGEKIYFDESKDITCPRCFCLDVHRILSSTSPIHFGRYYERHRFDR